MGSSICYGTEMAGPVVLVKRCAAGQEIKTEGLLVRLNTQSLPASKTLRRQKIYPIHQDDLVLLSIG